MSRGRMSLMSFVLLREVKEVCGAARPLEPFGPSRCPRVRSYDDLVGLSNLKTLWYARWLWRRQRRETGNMR